MMRIKRILTLFLVGAILLGLVGMSCSSSLEPLDGTAPSPEPTSEATATPTESALAPAFTLTDLDGESVSLSDFRGHPVLLNFWALWCSPCRAEFPHLDQISRTWADRGLVVLTVNLDRDISDVENFMEKEGFTLTVLMDEGGKVAASYDVFGIPVTFFIDGEGVAVGKRVGGYRSVEQIEDDLRQALYP